MSLTDELFNSALEHFESHGQQSFQHEGAFYCGTIADESHEEDFDETGTRHRWRVLIESTVGQFEGAYPKIRSNIVYNDRQYTIRSVSQDAHTIKLTCSTAAQ